MDLNYVINRRTNGANPFKIFEALTRLDTESLAYALRRMPYQSFLESSYWFAVSSVAKSRAGMRCQVCNSSVKLTTHHRTYDTHGKEHLNMFDLVVLDENCHGLFHGHKEFVPSTRERFEKEHQDRPRRARIGKGLILPHSEADLVMPDGDIITLTPQLIHNCRSNGSFTNAAINALGLTREDITAGWPARLIGKQILREDYKRALIGKFTYRETLNRKKL